MSQSARISGCLGLAALALVVALPAGAQQVVGAPTMAPQPVLSPEATALLNAALGIVPAAEGADATEAAGVAEPTMPADMQLLSRAFMFPSMQGGGTLSMMGFRLASSELTFAAEAAPEGAEEAEAAAPAPETAAVEIFGSIRQDDAEVRRIGTTARLPKAAATGMMTATFSLGETLPAGDYEVVWGVREVASGKAAMRRDELSVPNFLTSGLSTSSVLMVEGNPVSSPDQFQPNTVFYGVKIFTAAFLDGLTHEFARDANVMLAFLVSGAQFDSATQGQNIELSYSIKTSDGENVWRAAPQTQNRTTVGQPLPLGDIEELEAGNDYVLEIKVKDLMNDAETTSEVPFRIVG